MSTVDAATQNMIRNLEAKSGKTLAEWVNIAKASGSAKHGEIVKHLKAAHELGHGYANFVAHEALQSAAAHADSGDLIDEQYSGRKAALRPIYDRLLAAIQEFGSDVEVAPKKGYVSVRRRKQFALIQPSTATRVDVGINLKGDPATARLEASGSFNAMVTHRVRVSSAREVDKELIGWLREAYQRA